jgi:hypothetical protein
MALGFPGIFAIFCHYNVFLLSGPLLFIGGGAATIALKRKKHKTRKLNDLITAIVLLLMGTLHLLVFKSVSIAFQFRGLDLYSVDAFVVSRIRSEADRAEGPGFIYSQAANIRTAVATLRDAESYSRNNEHFVDGYQIQLVINGVHSDRYFTVFKDSSRGPGASVVIPHVGPKYQGGENNGGEYSAEAFVDWFIQEIEPLLTE